MRILLCLLALISAPAWAEWAKVSEDKDTIFYIDPATIRKDGNMRKVWMMTDLKQRHKDGEMSRRNLTEFDCKEERFRFLSRSAHSEPMARGNELLSSSRAGEWDHIPPGTVVAAVLKLVCSK